MEGEIQRLRALERAVVKDLTHSNNIVELRKVAANHENSKDIRTAAIHCLRRLFMELLENGKVVKPSGKEKGKSKKANDKYFRWFLVQYQDFQQTLCNLISSDEEWSHALSIRTLMELIKVDHLIFTNTNEVRYIADGSLFGLETFNTLLRALIFHSQEIDVDLLLMVKEEVMKYRDCTFYSLKLLRDIITELKEEYQQSALLNEPQKTDKLTELEAKKKNLLDFIRIVSISLDDDEEEEEEMEEEFWIAPHSAESYAEYLNTLNINDIKAMLYHSDEEDDDDDGNNYVEDPLAKKKNPNGEADQDADDDEQAKTLHTHQEQFLTKQQKQKQEEYEQVLSLLGKRKAVAASSSSAAESNNNKKKHQPEYEQLIDPRAFQKIFSKVWLSFLSLTFTIGEHKLILKHLPDHVITSLTNPLLLADYLTMAYDFGNTMISLLALESLFFLILQHNLDYPMFFESLYKLCNVDIFLAKYSYKYMKLLSLSLKSTNIPAYLIQCFVKKLLSLALVLPSTKTAYCIVQVIILLKHHRVSQRLVHCSMKKQLTIMEKLLPTVKLPKKLLDTLSPEEIRSKKMEYLQQQIFSVHENSQLEHSCATYTSLYEAIALRSHHIYEIAQLAKTLEDPETTSAGSVPPNIDQYMNVTYDDMIERELNPEGNEKGKDGKKKQKTSAMNTALAFLPPKGLFGDSFLGSMFGITGELVTTTTK